MKTVFSFDEVLLCLCDDDRRYAVGRASCLILLRAVDRELVLLLKDMHIELA